MGDPYLRNFAKVAIPLIAIAMILVLSRRRGISVRDDLGVRRPPLGKTLMWLAIYIAFMLVSNHFMRWRGPWDFTVWRKSPLVIDAMRVLAGGILGPIAEELIFRGYLYARLIRTRVGVRGGIVLLAAIWAMLHTAFMPGVIGLIFVDGLLLGAARYTTASVIPPILMHIAWNLYAVW